MQIDDTTRSNNVSAVFVGARPWKDFLLLLSFSVLLTGLVIIEQWLGIVSPVRVILGLFYLLYVPGYCLQSMLFPRADDFTELERLGLSIMFSIAFVPIVALVLDILPSGITFWSILGSYLVCLPCLAGVAIWRRSSLPEDVRHAPAPTCQPRTWWHTLAPFEKQIYLLMSVITIGIIGVSLWVFAVPAADELLTEFYVVNEDGRAENFPRSALPGEELTVIVGVAHHEQTAQEYRIEVWATAAADPTAEWTQVATVEPLLLQPGETFEQPVNWAVPWVADDTQIHFRLYREQESEPYRNLVLWMDVQEKPRP